MIRLESDGQLRCEIQPELGGCITLGLRTLQPGETVTENMSIAVERVT